MMRGKRVTELAGNVVALLQQDWNSGFLPANVIALKYGVDLTDLRETAIREEWAAAGIHDEQQQAQSLQQAIESAAVAANVDRVVSEDDREQGRTEPRVMTRDATVKQFGMVVAGVQAQQRADIKRARLYANTLMQQLEECVGPHVERDRVEALAKMIASDDPELAKLLTATPEAVDLMGRLKVLERKSGVLTRLVQAQHQLIQLERQSYGLDKPGGSSAGYDELLEEILEQRKKR